MNSRGLAALQTRRRGRLLDRHIGVGLSEPASLSGQRGASPVPTFPASRPDPPPACGKRSAAWIQVRSTIRSTKSTVLHDFSGFRRSPRACKSLKNLVAVDCHGSGRGFEPRCPRHHSKDLRLTATSSDNPQSDPQFTAPSGFLVPPHSGMRIALPVFRRGHPACRNSWLCGYRYAATCPAQSLGQPF